MLLSQAAEFVSTADKVEPPGHDQSISIAQGHGGDPVGVGPGRSIAAGPGQFGAIQAVAPTLGIEVSPINIRDAQQDAEEIERAVTTFAHVSNGGLIITGGY
jgi:hypothetical protein